VIDVALEAGVSAEEGDPVVEMIGSAQTYSKTLRTFHSTGLKRCFARYRVISEVQRLSLNHFGMNGDS